MDVKTKIEAIIASIKILIARLKMNNREKIYGVAKKYIVNHQDASPNDEAPDYLACAESVYTIIKEAGVPLKVEDITSTASLYKALITSPLFVRVINEADVLEGDIIICPTGMQAITSPLKHGHVGIMCKFGIGSNNSNNGIFDEGFTLTTWKKYYVDKGRFPLYFFRAI